MALSLGELAVRFGCELRGDPDILIASVGSLEAGPGAIGFVASGAYRDALGRTRISAVVLEAKFADACPTAALISRNPHATFARIAALLHPAPPASPGIHRTAVVDAAAQVDSTASVGAHTVVGARAVIGPRCQIGPHCVLEAGALLDADVRLVARVFVAGSVSIGPRCILHPGVVVGADGFGNAREGEGWLKVPQLGGVRIGADVEIGANTTIDRGALDDTVIEEGVKLDNQIQIAHNVVIGAHTAIAACVGIAGSTRIGKRCMIGGGTGITGQITLGDDIVVTGFGMITRSLDKPGLYSSVIPVEEARQWRRIVGRLKRIESMAARIAALERAAGVVAPPQDDNND